MLAWLNSNGLRVAGYVVAAIAAFVAGWCERSRVRSNPNLWPVFWFLTFGLFLLMAIGRIGDIAGVATELGRNEALSHGWYDRRREFQAALVGSLGAVWFVVVVVALWRVPARRRRYLPMAVISFSLMCFVGIRLISLHQVDAVLYRRQLGEAKVGTLIEMFGIVTAIVVTVRQTRGLVAGSAADLPEHAGASRGCG